MRSKTETTYLFRMYVVVTYHTDNPATVDNLYGRVEQAVDSLKKTLGYTITWGQGKIRVPIQSMGQSVTESDSLIIERIFHQARNVRSLEKLMSALFEMLSSTRELTITYSMEEVHTSV